MVTADELVALFSLLALAGTVTLLFPSDFFLPFLLAEALSYGA